MTEPRRITGFMPMAKGIIIENPGLTAQEIFRIALRRSESMGIKLSAAANPESSLIATLHKCHQDFDIERVRQRDGKLRFYDKSLRMSVPPDVVVPISTLGSLGNSDAVEGGKKENAMEACIKCCIGLPDHLNSKVRALVDLGLYSDEHEAHTRLVERGLEAVLTKLDS